MGGAVGIDERVTTTWGRGRPWCLERALFALAGSMTLTSLALGVAVSRWFLLLAAGTALSQWAYVLVGACPASMALRRVAGLRGCVR